MQIIIDVSNLVKICFQLDFKENHEANLVHFLLFEETANLEIFNNFEVKNNVNSGQSMLTLH